MFMSKVPVFSLDLGNDWQLSAVETPYPILYLTRRFWLEPLDMCVGYWLHIENVPAGATLYLNDQRVCSIENSDPHVIDVTDFVWLEWNKIMVEISYTTYMAPFSLDNTRLEAIPCE